MVVVVVVAIVVVVVVVVRPVVVVERGGAVGQMVLVLEVLRDVGAPVVVVVVVVVSVVVVLIAEEDTVASATGMEESSGISALPHPTAPSNRAPHKSNTKKVRFVCFIRCVPSKSLISKTIHEHNTRFVNWLSLSMQILHRPALYCTSQMYSNTHLSQIRPYNSASVD